jgi:hypothetical protein
MMLHERKLFKPKEREKQVCGKIMKQNLVIRKKSFIASDEPYALVRRPYGSDPGA